MNERWVKVEVTIHEQDGTEVREARTIPLSDSPDRDVEAAQTAWLLVMRNAAMRMIDAYDNRGMN